jgi:hypothetical protein
MSNWLDASSTSNKYRQMYIKGFLDISGGNLILRNNHLLVKQGDASFNRNIYVNNTATIKNLLVNGDVSMNGNVYINFKNNSISPDAIIGGIPASTGTFSVDMSLNNRLFVANDVSLNSNLYVANSIFENGQSLSSKYSTINSPTFTGTATFANATVNNKFVLIQDGSFNNRLFVSGDIYQNGVSIRSQYANIASPAFTGTPTAPTATDATNSTQIATTAFVSTKFTNILDNVTASLNTLNKLASAIGFDPSFSANIYTRFNSTVSSYQPSFFGTATANQFLAASIVGTTDISTNKLIVIGDTSMNSNLKVGKNIFEGGVLLTSKYSQINSPTFTGIVTIPTANITTLNNSGDASFNGNMKIGGNVTMNNILDISGSLITHNNMNVYGIINQYTTTLDQGYIVNYNNISGNGDISANGIKLEKSTHGENSAFGISAGSSLTSGTNNTMIGFNAGSNLTSGSNNIIIGSNTTSSTSSISNEITLGNNSISVLRCQASSITSLSDVRDKKNIEKLPIGLYFINTLEPVKFDWNTRDGSKVDTPEFGFIAQQLLAAQEHSNIVVPNLVNDSNPDKLEASYGTLIPIMVKAIKELTSIVSKQQDEIDSLKDKLSKIF